MYYVNLIRTNCAFAESSENVWNWSTNTYTWIYTFFTRKNLIFINFKSFFEWNIDLVCSLVIVKYNLVIVFFPIQSSGFIKSVNFGCHLKKSGKKNLKFLIFHLKIDFYSLKNMFLIWKRAYSDIPELDFSDDSDYSDEIKILITLKFKISIGVESYDEKTAEN